MMMTIYVGVVIMLLFVLVSVVFYTSLPIEYLQVGDKVHIYVDGMYDRTATITGCKHGFITIYGSLRLPLDYRGPFYGSGTDSNGVRLWYLSDREHYRYMRMAEWMRRRFHILPDQYNLSPVYEDEETEKDGARTAG